MVTLSAEMNLLGFKKELFHETKSILQTVKNLYQGKNYFVSGLILLFSVLVPFFKGIMLLVVMVMKNEIRRYRIYTFVRNISKWSMADVFVVGTYVAYMSANATDNMDAKIEIGFYYFAAYCLVSLISLQFLWVKDPHVAKLV